MAEDKLAKLREAVSKMTRYDHEVNYRPYSDDCGCYSYMDEYKHGEYVRWNDLQEILRSVE